MRSSPTSACVQTFRTKAMTDARLAGVAAALAMDVERRATHYLPPGTGPGAWQQDYGPQRRASAMGTAGLSGGGSWHSDGDSGPDRKDGVDDRDRRSRQTLWRQMMMALCPGTRVFVVCLAVATFIAVV